MNKKSMYSLILIASLLGLLSLSAKIQDVRAPYLIITIEADGTVSPALDAISTLDNVTYTFTANISAAIVIQRSNIVVDGDGWTLDGIDFTIWEGLNLTSVNNVTITNVNIERFASYSIYLDSASQCVISKNTVTGSEGGIGLFSSTGNTVSENMITGCIEAVELIHSSGNKISGNNISADSSGFYLYNSTVNMISENNVTGKSQGIGLSISSHNTIAENTITNSSWRGITLTGSSNNTLSGNNVTDSDTGVRAGSALVDSVLVKSTDNTILGNNIVNCTNGIDVIGVLFTTISRNHITENSQYGIALDAASNNTICENNIQNNTLGVFYDGLCDNNTAYHNNFIDNTKQVEVSPGDIDTWDDGIEGNYWSNYTDVDLNHDGIGDSWHEINENNIDHFPLMGPFHNFNTSVSEYVSVVSNSTVTYFNYVEAKGWITIQVRNATTEQTFGFCRISIPHNLIDPEVTWINVVIDDGTVTPLYFNNTIYDNGTHRWIYFAYPHPYSLHEITIVPEFSLFLVLPLFMMATLLAALAYRKRQTLKPRNSLFL